MRSIYQQAQQTVVWLATADRVEMPQRSPNVRTSSAFELFSIFQEMAEAEPSVRQSYEKERSYAERAILKTAAVKDQSQLEADEVDMQRKFDLTLVYFAPIDALNHVQKIPSCCAGLPRAFNRTRSYPNAPWKKLRYHRDLAPRRLTLILIIHLRPSWPHD
jgi:hypothetical protein